MITIASSFTSRPHNNPSPKQHHRPQLLSLPHHDHDTHHRLVRDPAVFLETSLTLFLLEKSFSLNVLTAALFGYQHKPSERNNLVGGWFSLCTNSESVFIAGNVWKSREINLIFFNLSRYIIGDVRVVALLCKPRTLDIIHP